MNVNFNPNFEVNQNKNTSFGTRVKQQKPDAFEGKTKKAKKDIKTKVKEFFTKFKTGFVALGSSLMTGLAVFALTTKKYEDTITENQNLQQANTNLQGENSTLQDKNKRLQEKNKQLRTQLNDIVLPEDFKSRVDEKIGELINQQLTYSPTTRIDVSKKRYSRLDDIPITILPETYEKTNLRSDAQRLDYPKFIGNKPYNFEFPMSEEVVISHASSPVNSQPRTITTVSESYADSLLWDNDKIARDLMQNFYDGHGQTLDGVKIDVQPIDGWKYKVRIDGKSTFSADKAILLGETTKKNNDRAAGNYGEGLKMVVLKLLREKGAEEVNISSGNWKVNWNFEDSGFGKKVLAYKLDEIEPIEGNYIEFNTDNQMLVRSIINSFDRFYHHNNPAFKCPDFENDILGIKLDNKEENGHFYIAGQAFEVDGYYEALKKMNIYIKKKPPVKYKDSIIFDPSRDRTSLTSDNLKSLGKWIVAPENMSKEDVVKLVHSLEEYWDSGTDDAMFKDDSHAAAFVIGIFEGIYKHRSDINIKFDKKYISDDWRVSQELKDSYMRAGYKICNSYLKFAGMRSIEELVEESRKHTPLEPTPIEKNKILILKDAIQLLAPILKEDGFFTESELDTKIFIFDKNSPEEDRLYKNTIGEAIIRDKTSLGFWLDRTALKDSDFSTMLGTSLHELTHKFGGDGSENFSYKLTDVLEKMFAAINENPNLAVKLKILEEAWNAQN